MPVRSSASWTNTFCSMNCILAHPLSCSLQTCPPEKKRKEKKRKEKKRKEKKRKEKKRKEKKRKEKKRKGKERKGKERKDYAFRRQFNEKPSIIPGFPGDMPPTINPQGRVAEEGRKRDQAGPKAIIFFCFWSWC